MRSWSIRLSMLALMLVAFAGCDSNPEGPAAPNVTVNPDAAGAAPATTVAPGTMPGKGKGKSPGTTAPVKPD